MAQIIAWNDISFALGGTSINGAEDIEITGSCETEDTESGGEKYVKRKNGKPYEIEMKAILDARLGVNVQSMATKMTEAARCSTSGYFYTGSAKLFPCSFMMVEASIVEIEINPQGVWTHCEVKLKLKQSTIFAGPSAASSSSGGGSSGGGSSGGSSSSKKTSTKTTALKTSSSNSDVDVISMAAPSTSQASKSVSSAIKNVAKVVSTAKSVSSAASSAAKAVTSAVSKVASAVKKAASSTKKK